MLAGAPSSLGDSSHYASADRYHHHYYGEHGRPSLSQTPRLSSRLADAASQSGVGNRSPRGRASRTASPTARRKLDVERRAVRSPDQNAQRGRAKQARSPLRSVEQQPSVARRSPHRTSSRTQLAKSPLRSGQQQAHRTRRTLSPPPGPLRAATRLVGDGWLVEQSAEVEQLMQKLDRVRSRSVQIGVRVNVSPERMRPAVAKRGSLGQRTVHDVYGDHAVTNNELQTQVAAVSLALANERVTDFTHHASTLRKQSSEPIPSETPDLQVGHWVGSVPSAGGVWLPCPDGEGLGAKRFASVLDKIARRQEAQRQKLAEQEDAAARKIAEKDEAAAYHDTSPASTRVRSPQQTGVRLVPVLSLNSSSPRTIATDVASDDSDETEVESDFETDTEIDTSPAALHTELSTSEPDANVPELSAALRSLGKESSQQPIFTARPLHRRKSSEHTSTSSSSRPAAEPTASSSKRLGGEPVSSPSGRRRKKPSPPAVSKPSTTETKMATSSAPVESLWTAGDVSDHPRKKQMGLGPVETLQEQLPMLKSKQELRKAARQAAIDEDDFNEAIDADGWEKAGVDLIIAARFPDLKSPDDAADSIAPVTVSSSVSAPTASAASPATQAEDTEAAGSSKALSSRTDDDLAQPSRPRRRRKEVRGCCASKPPTH